MEWEPVIGHHFIRPSFHAFPFPNPLFESDSDFDFDSNTGTAYETRKKGGCGWESDSESVSRLGEEAKPHLPLALMG